MYGIEDGLPHFEEMFQGKYIKMKEVEQNLKADTFAACFNDDGVFKLRTFGRDNRTSKEI